MSSFPLTNSYFSRWLLHHQQHDDYPKWINMGRLSQLNSRRWRVAYRRATSSSSWSQWETPECEDPRDVVHQKRRWDRRYLGRLTKIYIKPAAFFSVKRDGGFQGSCHCSLNQSKEPIVGWNQWSMKQSQEMIDSHSDIGVFLVWVVRLNSFACGM
jgi:hypothetical protein